MRMANDGIPFLLELCMLAAFAVSGGLAAAALAAADRPAAAVAFGVVAAVNTTLVHAIGE